MSFDLTALRRAVKRHRAAHEARPDRRKTTGATALIRAALPEIRRLRDLEGQPWAVIAAALGEQGVHEGREGRAISADRLIALVRHIEAQIARDSAKRAENTDRRDLTPVSPGLPQPPARPSGPDGSPTRPRLAPELQPHPSAAPEDEPLSEAEILRLQAEKHRNLFKKD